FDRLDANARWIEQHELAHAHCHFNYPWRDDIARCVGKLRKVFEYKVCVGSQHEMRGITTKRACMSAETRECRAIFECSDKLVEQCCFLLRVDGRRVFYRVENAAQ